MQQLDLELYHHGKIIARMLEEYRKEHKEENIEAKIEELAKKRKTVNKNSTNGIEVKGIDNCLVKFSKCCNPVPGDSIIGYITKGRGVSIHRTDCKNVKELIEDEDRIIDVKWIGEEKASYNVDIEIYSNDRTGLLADIIQVMNNSKISILGVNARVTKAEIVITDLKIEVQNIDKLNKALKDLRKVNNVYEVRRKN